MLLLLFSIIVIFLGLLFSFSSRQNLVKNLKHSCFNFSDCFIFLFHQNDCVSQSLIFLFIFSVIKFLMYFGILVFNLILLGIFFLQCSLIVFLCTVYIFTSPSDVQPTQLGTPIQNEVLSVTMSLPKNDTGGKCRSRHCVNGQIGTSLGCKVVFAFSLNPS